MEQTISTVHAFVFMGITTLYFFQSGILFARSKNNKARRTMAYLELLWGAEYLTTLIVMLTIFEADEYMLLREKVLIVGNFFIMLTHLFPIQVLLPGWLNWKRLTLLFLPIIGLTVIYYGGIFLLGESPEHLESYEMVWNSIGHFNVWFRLVFLVSNFVYIFMVLRWLYGYEKRYLQWKNENFSDQEYVDISWMRSYDCIIVGIFLFYLGILFLGGRIPVICHSTFAVLSFSYLFYKALFYESPYPEDFFANSASEKQETAMEETFDCPISDEMKEGMNDLTFESKLDSYASSLKTWLEEEKPFLYYDFKLADVARFLPLNRSYLSRIFNAGFGQNFSEVIRTYRVNYAKEILKRNPDMPMYKVAELSGFRSDSTFVRAFKQVTQMTPGQFKAEGTTGG